MATYYTRLHSIAYRDLLERQRTLCRSSSLAAGNYGRSLSSCAFHCFIYLGGVGANDSSQILACGIVVTLILGCLKLVYAHWRLRKYSAVAEQEKHEQAIQRQKSQKRRAAVGNAPKAIEDIPFGIRAIERGVEVEGVWISRGNTPDLLASDMSSPASSIRYHTQSGSLDIDLEKQDTRKGSTSTSRTSIAAPRSSEDAPMERHTRRNSMEGSTLDVSTSRPSRVKFPPVSYHRYCGNPYLLKRPSNTTNTLEALESIYRASTSIHGEDSNNSESSSQSTSTDSGGPISASAPTLLTHQPRPKPRRQSSSSLELLNRHRTSQVAETGQLTPRGRRTSQRLSIDLSKFSTTSRDSTSQDVHDYRATSSRKAGEGSGSTSPVKLSSSPTIGALPPAVRIASMPDVTPFTEFCRRTPQSPPLSRSQSKEVPAASSPPNETQTQYDDVPDSPIIPASAGATALRLPPPAVSKTSFEHRPASQVVRGRGTGFEILRPGSFQSNVTDGYPAPDRKTAPPLSLKSSSRSRRASMCSAESLKKLQKKQRMSLDSSANSVTSRWSRISLFS